MNDILLFLTDKPEVANALAALAGTLIAVSAIIVSVISLFVAHAALENQRRHNVLSVKPIPHVTVADYENRLTVKLRNHGTGPMIVKSLVVTNGCEQKSTLIGWMPRMPEEISWNTFFGKVVNRSIVPDGEIILLELIGNELEEPFVTARDAVRRALCILTVQVEYTDVYDSIMNLYEKPLTWFARLVEGREDCPSIPALRH